MKQSEKLDLILKELYQHKYDGKSYSLYGILQQVGIEANHDEIFTLGKKLEDDGYIEFQGGLKEFISGAIKAKGIEYVEEGSYTFPDSPIINNQYNFTISNSPNANIVHQSNNVTISQNVETINNQIAEIEQKAESDSAISQEQLAEIKEVLQEVKDGLHNGKKPKHAFKSLLGITGEFASIAGLVAELGHIAGLY